MLQPHSLHLLHQFLVLSVAAYGVSCRFPDYKRRLIGAPQCDLDCAEACSHSSILCPFLNYMSQTA